MEFRARDMLRTPQFYMLWAVFMFAGLSGLMVIYCIKLFGIDALEYHGVAGAGAITGTAMAWYAIFNGLGRIAWGSVSDRIGRKTTITLMSVLQGVTMLMTYHVFISFGLVYGFIVAAALIGFNYGGSFASVPGHHGGLLRQQERRQQLRLDVHGVRRRRSRRTAAGRLFQGCGARRRSAGGLDDTVHHCRLCLSAGRDRHGVHDAATAIATTVFWLGGRESRQRNELGITSAAE